jgi:hypothetical protein
MNDITEHYQSEKSAPADRASAGPFDASEVHAERQLLDLGSIRLPMNEGVQVRVEVEDGTERVVAVTVEYDDSTLQLQAFAAPRSEGLWHSVRAQMTEAVVAQEGSAEARVGSLGQEVLAKIPLLNDKGEREGTRFARFVGVDGPKWFLRGVIAGAAITDPKDSADMDDIFRSVIVYRDETPLPPRESLPLHMPGGVVSPPRVS